MQLHADKAITLNCQGSCPYVIGGVEDWEVDDPAGKPLEDVREIRDDIERRVRDLVEYRADEIRTDRSGHARRLAQLLPPSSTSSARKPADEIRACADAILTTSTTSRSAPSCSPSQNGGSASASAIGMRGAGLAARHGAFMEPSGRNRWQPVANGTRSKTAQTGRSATGGNPRQPFRSAW